MKRIFITLLALMTVAGVSAMTESRVRTETLFLTDKMAYELRLSSSQYNDVYEINYDFMSAVCNTMDDVVYGESWALNDYYEALDIRNDDLRWVLSSSQYRRFLGEEYFCRPIYQTNSGWGLRIYITYTNPNVYYRRWPSAYTTYFGGHYRGGFDDTSYYRYRYSRFSHYNRPFRMNGDGYRYNTYVNRDFKKYGDNRYYNNRSTNRGFHIGNDNNGGNNNPAGNINRGNRYDNNNRYYNNNNTNNVNRNYNRNNGSGYDRNTDVNSSRGKNVDINTNNTNINNNVNRNYNRNNGSGYDRNTDVNSSRGKNVDVNTNNTNINNNNRNYNRNNGGGYDRNTDGNSSRNKNVDVNNNGNNNGNNNSSRRNYDRSTPASSPNKVIKTPVAPTKSAEKHSRR